MYRQLVERNSTNEMIFQNEKKDPLVYYGPVVDSAAAKPFLPKEPNELEPANIPWLTGITSGEGIIKTASNYPFKMFHIFILIPAVFKKWLNIVPHNYLI